MPIWISSSLDGSDSAGRWTVHAALQMCGYHNWVLFLLLLSSPPNSDALRVSREDKNVRFFSCLHPFMLKVWKFMGAECEDITYHRAAGPVTDQKGDRDWGGSTRPGAGLYPAVPDSLDPLSGAAQSLLSRELAVSWQTREHNLSHSEDVTPRSLDSLSDSQQPSSSRNFWY